MRQLPICVKSLPGGVTNHNYILHVGETKLVIRVAGEGTGNYINRVAEMQNAEEMSKAGIGPKVYFSEPDTGFMISEFVEGNTMTAEQFQNSDSLLKAAAEVLSRCHSSGAQFGNVFSPIEKIKENLSILQELNFTDRYEEWEKIIGYFNEIAGVWKEESRELVPCHNDTLAGNFLGDEKELRMIDWEYSGMNDPYYDLACFSMENELDMEKEQYFLNCYCQGTIQREDYHRFYENKFLTAFYWSVWSLVQIAYGKDREFYYPYGKVRYEFAKEAWKNLKEFEI